MVIFHVVAEKGTKMRHFEKNRGFHEFGSIEFHRGNVVFSTWEVPIDTSSTIAIQDLTWRDNHFLYPDAPCMEYLLTKLVDFWGKCRDSYSIHGAYGYIITIWLGDKPSMNHQFNQLWLVPGSVWEVEMNGCHIYTMLYPLWSSNGKNEGTWDHQWSKPKTHAACPYAPWCWNMNPYI